MLQKKRGRQAWFVVEWLCLVLIAGMRYRVGGDTLAYHDYFEEMPKLGELFSFDYSSSHYNDVLWVLLTAVCKSLVNDFAFFQIVHALIVNTSFLCFFRKRTRMYFTATLFYGLLFYFTFNTELLRAAISVSVFLWSYKYLIKKEWLKYFLCFILAFGFHSESIIMVFLPLVHLLKRIRVNRNFFILLISLSLFFTVFIDFSAPFSRLSFVSDKMSTSLEFYLDPDRTGKISWLGYAKFFLFQMPWLYFIYAVRNQYLKSFLSIYYFVIFQSLHYSNILQRELDFLLPILVVAIAESFRFVKMTPKKWKPVQITLLTSSVSIILFQQVLYFITDNRWLLFVPYNSIFNPVDNPIRDELFYLLQHN